MSYKIEKVGFNFLEDSWRNKCNLPPKKEKPKLTLKEIAETQWNDKFEKLSRNRLIMGYFRYGDMWEEVGKWDNIGSAIKRLELYLKTGNTEHLVDASNLCNLEFTNGNHPNKHFKAVDDGEHTTLK